MIMAGFGFYFDASSCSGCKTCQVACKDKNDLGPGVRYRRVYEVCGGGWEKTPEGAWKQELAAYNISIACNHCGNAPCTDACPTKAMHRTPEGYVLVDASLCIGCRYCEWACPYGAPQFDPARGVMGKCDFCADYISQGRPPACVSACPMRALDFGPIELLELKYGENRDIYPLPHGSAILPAWIVKNHPAHEKARNLKASIINREEVKNA
jgi:anaerobic dimethyl sulfoxide reductase subunit B (iron-sulfur subunit)